LSDKDENFNERFLSEALPLISSYFSGAEVELGPQHVSADEEEDWGTEFGEFISLIKLRHALGCCSYLMTVTQEIEAGASHTTTLIRSRTSGVVRGRLDIPLYIAERASTRLLAKTYPIILLDESPNTPENQVAKQLMNEILQRFRRAPIPEATAEKRLSAEYSLLISRRLGQYPWAEVRGPSGGLRRTALEAKHRIAKRQTGNEPAYRRLVELVNRWLLEFEKAGPINNHDAVVKALLAFPSSLAFDDRIFEIWCLKELARAFESCGAVLIDGPTPLALNSVKPIYVFRHGERLVRIWFQKALNTEFAQWHYEGTKPLRGIPDITVENDGCLLLLDSKNRLADKGVRPEETYKMLGYFENFRPILIPPYGLVCFTSIDDFHRTLNAKGGGTLALMSAHPFDPQSCKLAEHLRNSVGDWLASI